MIGFFKTIARISLVALATLVATTDEGADARTQTSMDLGDGRRIPCRDVLRYDFRAWVKAADTKYHLFWKMAPGIYEECRQKDNDRRASKLSAIERARIKRLRGYLKTWSNSGVEMCRAAAGGGTAFPSIENNYRAEAEDVISDVIHAMRSSYVRAGNRSRPALVLLRVRSTFPLLTMNAGRRKADHRRNERVFRTATVELRSVVLELPKMSSNRLGAFLKKVADYVIGTHIQHARESAKELR